jgi:hypothetical protein
MSKQTAVEWLIEEIINHLGIRIENTKDGVNLINQAKEMEKEQMWEYIKKNYCIGNKSLEFHRLEFEQYYNETYKKEEK